MTTSLQYPTDWFAMRVAQHDEVSKAEVLDPHRVRLERTTDGNEPLTIAPVGVAQLEATHVELVLDEAPASIICLVPRASHYSWEAREQAQRRNSTVQTYKELFTFLHVPDPRPLLDKNVAYAIDVLSQHDKVARVEMICEASMRILRTNSLSDVTISIEYEYEFSQEAIVRALKKHPDVDAVLNANPNGRPMPPAVSHAGHARVGLFRLRELMGALNYGGAAFTDYQAPDRRR